MRVVSVSIVGFVDQFDFLDEFLLLLIEVGTCGVEDQTESASFGDGLRSSVELFDCLELIFFTY